MALFSTHKMKGSFVQRMPSLHHEHGSYRWWVLFNVMIGTFMAVLDATIVNVALPKIMASFGIDVDKAEWILTVYLLVFAVMLPTSGWVADHLGYKRTYFSALFLFTLGSFLCGLAWDENALIIFRIVQAAGAGFLMPVGMAIITREFPVEQRGLALGFWSIAAAASVSLGPLIGGYLVDHIGWNAIFDVNVPVGFFGLFATVVIQREYKTEKTRSFDIVGFVSSAVFLSTLLLALSDGNASWNTGGWSSTFIISCFFISAIALIVFLFTELTIEHPLIELRLLKNFNFGVTNAILFIFGLGMFGSTFLLPLYLQNSLGYTALQAGAVFLPMGIMQAVTSPIAGYLSDKVNPKIPAVIGLALLALSLLLNTSLSLFTEHAQIMLPLYIRGFAMGLVFTPLSTLALSEIPRHKIAQASGLFNVLRQLGGSFGVALMGALLTRRVIFHTAMYGQAVDPHSPAFQNVISQLTHFSQHAVGGTASVSAMRANALVANNIVQQAFVSAINDDFLVAAGITALALIPIFILRTHKKKATKKEQHAALE
jgi:MFS transporter, DHA2 family, multidrug resistance protein